MLSLTKAARHPIFKLGRKALRNISSRWPYPVTTSLYTGQRIFVDLRSAIGRGIFVQGKFDQAVGNAILNILEEGDTFIDIGANVGYYSILALSKLGSNGLVFAFEVDPRSLRCLFLSKEKFGYKNLIVNGVAVGESAGVTGIGVNGEMGNTFVITDTFSDLYPSLALDVFFDFFKKKPLKLIKIDVEGGELAVLKGIKLVVGLRPIIILEAIESHMARFNYTKKDLVEFLNGLNYEVEPLEGSIDVNLLCRPRMQT